MSQTGSGKGVTGIQHNGVSAENIELLAQLVARVLRSPSMARPQQLQQHGENPFVVEVGSYTTLGVAFRLYEKEHSHRREISRDQIRLMFENFLMCNRLRPSMYCNVLTKAHCIRFKEFLKTETKQKACSQSRNIRYLTHFLTWLHRQEFIEQIWSANLDLPARLVRDSKVIKRAFTVNELADIFSHPYMRAKRDHPLYREDYWAIHLLALTGARRGEIIHLMKADIHKADGPWCVNIKEEPEKGKLLKNRVSERVVPLHDQLLKLDFIEDYWSTVPDGGKLFPRLVKQGRSLLSTVFNELREQISPTFRKDKTVSLHCFRHTMASRLAQQQVHPFIIRRLLGHALGQDVESRVYLNSVAYPIEELREALNKVRYPELDYIQAKKYHRPIRVGKKVPPSRFPDDSTSEGDREVLPDQTA